MIVIIYSLLFMIILLTMVLIYKKDNHFHQYDNFTSIGDNAGAFSTSSSNLILKKNSFTDIFSVYWNQYIVPTDKKSKCIDCEKQDLAT